MVSLNHSTVGRGLPVTVKSNRAVLPSATADDTGLAVTPALTGWRKNNMAYENVMCVPGARECLCQGGRKRSVTVHK